MNSREKKMVYKKGNESKVALWFGCEQGEVDGLSWNSNSATKLCDPVRVACHYYFDWYINITFLFK